MVNCQGAKFGVVLLLFEIGMALIYGFMVIYGDNLIPKQDASSTVSIRETRYFYFQDVQGMMFIGFGFLMTFLKKYGFSSVSINFLLSVVSIQWGLVMNGTKHLKFKDGPKIPIDVDSLLGAEFTTAAILISFGAVLGKLSPLQYLIMCIIEVPIQVWNEYLGREIFHAVDAGDSIFVHEFGAFFGLGVAWLITTKEAKEHSNDGSRYNSDLFAMMATLFLWIFWPSFNSGGLAGDAQQRAIVNTILGLTSCVVITLVINSFVDYDKEMGIRGKFNMVYIQNATLSGGVAIGSIGDMMITPWIAIIMGVIAGSISTLGYRYLSPLLTKIYLHDTCGVNNLHGMPGLLSGFASALFASLATSELYGSTYYSVFPELQRGRTTQQQALYQLAAVGSTFLISFGSGVLVGALLRLVKVCDIPRDNYLFNDSKFFELPSEKTDDNIYEYAVNDIALNNVVVREGN